jgi:4-diphosphocytidyl-2-C-methyl-D-erythritol kinase
MISIEAPAKLTLSLAITGVREDGYHLIDAEMVSLTICDDIVIEEAATTSINVVGKFAQGVPTDDSNLVARALHLLNRHAEVRIEKNIPHGGGLGGGSSDAAAVLRAARFTDLVAASRLGADIPFCMVGGRARVTGIGEIIEPLAYVEHRLTLIIRPFRCLHLRSTPHGTPWVNLGEIRETTSSQRQLRPTPRWPNGEIA